jgi:hypothetical protein
MMSGSWPTFRSMPAVLAMEVSWHTAVRVLLRLPLPALRVPRVLGVDDFAVRRRHCYATILVDAETRSSPATGPLTTSTALPALRAAQTGDAKELVSALPSWGNNPGRSQWARATTAALRPRG